MTTIAARRNDVGQWELAADSQETVEGTDAGDIKLPCQKLFMAPHGVVIATAGDTAMGLKFVAHMRKQGGFKANPDRQFECLVLDRNGVLWLWDQDMTPQEITTPFFAIGTGRMAAFAAMEQGANPRRAVEIAAKYDPYTGGDIVVVP